ncbi:MAG: HAD family hydrolase [Clostridia bacterium]|nr:HAD family hydrolase [Clostridia bacterium]
MKKYDACVFDLDGTLIDSLGDLASCCNEALSLYELPTHNIEEYRYFVGSGIKNLIKRSMGSKADDEKLFISVYRAFNMLYEVKCLEKTKPYDGIIKMLSKLKESGVKVAVLSNKSDEFANRIVNALFEKGEFDVVWGKKENFPIKPEPESLYAVLDELKCDKSKCLYIGDSDVDVITAKNADIHFCGVEWGFRGEEELSTAGAETIVKNPNDILNLVCA